MIALLIVINITIAGAFVAYSYMAATKLKGAGTLLQDGDTEGAGDMLNRAGTMYMNIIIASVTLAIVVALVSIEVASRSGTKTEMYYEVNAADTEEAHAAKQVPAHY
mgnify:CR=1 FL=1